MDDIFRPCPYIWGRGVAVTVEYGQEGALYRFSPLRKNISDLKESLPVAPPTRGKEEQFEAEIGKGS